MSRDTVSYREPESAWGASLLRLTIFYSPHDTVSTGLWEQIVGQQPDSSVSKPKSGEFIEIGTVDGAQLVLHTQHRIGRIDWIMQATDIPDQPPPRLPEALKLFLTRMGVFLKRNDLPVVNRMAFGLVVLLSVADAEDGYRKLSDYLSFDIDRKTSRDFSYQINRRRPSNTISVDVNRLSKWSVGLFNRQSLAVTSEGLVAIADPEVAMTCCQLELDINTIPESDIKIDSANLPSLLIELSSMATEIVREGDIQ